MIAAPIRLTVFPFALIDDEPWFLVLRPRAVWTDLWEPLRGECWPSDSPAASALHLAENAGLAGIERVMDVRQGAWEHAFGVRLEAPEVNLDWSTLDDARWVPYHAASALLEESDRRALRQLNGVLSILHRKIDVIFEEVVIESGCSGGGCSSSGGGCGSSSSVAGSCGTSSGGCGTSGGG
ncbi:MAG: hypothetical protein K8T20_14490 [Planctomycetes bacterium]|nr:hypothetical protein [Planctomycetota bacterium]